MVTGLVFNVRESVTKGVCVTKCRKDMDSEVIISAHLSVSRTMKNRRQGSSSEKRAS